MNIAAPLAEGFTGFALLLVSDLLQTRKRNGGVRKPAVRALSVPAYTLVAGSILHTVILTPLASAPVPFTLALTGSAVVWGALTLYSVLIEIPLFARGSNLYVKGTYGLSRHPGFLWFFLMMLSLVLLYRDTSFLLAASMLVLLDFLLVLCEDALVFPGIFVGYDEYRRTVPFLVPRIPFFSGSGWRVRGRK